MKKTPCNKFGYKPEDVFVVVENRYPYFKEGDICVLLWDDFSDMPQFQVFDTELIYGIMHIPLSFVKKIGRL